MLTMLNNYFDYAKHLFTSYPHERVNDGKRTSNLNDRKANVVADALSRKVLHSAALITKQAPLLRDFVRAKIADLVGEVTSQLAQLSVQSTLRQRIIVAQLNDPSLVQKRCLAEVGQDEEFSNSSDDGLTFERRLCVPARLSF
ncbi:pol protein [Cucumis melo var. makuwa]|uniref:Pol protein n=1 Tax=Cucumis melo var. makuwa TaxID=1194695 RepID=A0A5A7V0K1_CUCMM|nr:pol protein [Cucumis melo var. makuwa]